MYDKNKHNMHPKDVPTYKNNMHFKIMETLTYISIISLLSIKFYKTKTTLHSPKTDVNQSCQCL